jgi:UDP-2,3-diacylglucosamine hydrolase
VKVFFLSDLHLETGFSPAAVRFTGFLASQLARGDILLLGGDIFDLLVGDKQLFRERFRPVLDELTAAASRGVQEHYLEGNHDFHFAGIFAGQSKIQIHRDDFELPTRKIYVSHGDLIDEEDKGYRFLRAATKNAPFRAFVAALPGRAVDFIGSRSSGASRKYTSGRVENEGTDRLRKLYSEFARTKVGKGFQHVLVGHSHLQDQVALECGGNRGEYVNLGFSADVLRYAVLEAGASRFEIHEIR